MYDLMVVGARRTGAPTAMLLARRGGRVLPTRPRLLHLWPHVHPDRRIVAAARAVGRS